MEGAGAGTETLKPKGVADLRCGSLEGSLVRWYDYLSTPKKELENYVNTIHSSVLFIDVTSFKIFRIRELLRFFSCFLKSLVESSSLGPMTT